MRIVVSNFSPPRRTELDFREFWATHSPPEPPVSRHSLFEQPADWGFHITALGVLLLDRAEAARVELWDFGAERSMRYHSTGVLWVRFSNLEDVRAYVERYGAPDLFVNYGREGRDVLRLLAGRSFRVHVPCLRASRLRRGNEGAECYLVDDERFLDRRSMLYVPVVNPRVFCPQPRPAARDFVYLASLYRGKRHDLLLDAVRGSALTGHLHPIDGSRLDLAGTRVTTSDWNECDVVELLRTSRIAVYPGDDTSNPAAMWECVATGLPIVVNKEIQGGKHLVVPGVTGELAPPRRFREVMEQVLERRESYRPHEHFVEHWDAATMLDRYLAFFAEMGWRPRVRRSG